MQEHRPILFLDIDGVLIHAGSARHADPHCVSGLNQIIEETNAAIVVSSSWRMAGLDKIRGILHRWGVRADIVGITGDLSKRNESGVYVAAGRGAEIAEWRRLNHHVGSFAILDDDNDMGDLESYLVQTDYRMGLMPVDVEQAIELLKETA